MRNSPTITLPLALAAALLGACADPPTSGDQPDAGPLTEPAAAQAGGVRATTPPSDWIAHAYHGALLDADLQEIVLDAVTLTAMQASIFDTIYPATRSKAFATYGKDLKDLFHANLQGLDQLIARGAALHGLINVADPALRQRYAGRLIHMRAGVTSLIAASGYQLPQRMIDLIQIYRIPEWLRPPPPIVSYVGRCRLNSVPIPPDWPDPRWVHQGRLQLDPDGDTAELRTASFILSGLRTEVYTYRDPAVAGVCYALPRMDGPDSIAALGIICQSETTGKACFWDNKTRDGASITGTNVVLRIGAIGDGYTLAENCTDCHRGGNAFLIHPGTPLDLRPRSGVAGGPWDTDPAVRYTPIGQATWRNPPPLALPPPPGEQRSCTGSHELPQTRPSTLGVGDYCEDVLRPASRRTMPEGSTVAAGWPTATLADYADHIARLAVCP